MTRWHSDYVSALLEEIALEGLEGITIEALWTRLNVRPKFFLRPDSQEVKSFLWKAIIRLSKVEFYSLPDPRKPLVLFDRFDYVDSTGHFVEPDDVSIYNIYEHKAINKNGEMGSCSTYDERINISKTARTMELKEAAAIWGESLVIVANQDVRKLILTNPDYNPLNEMSVMQYCILERIGRSRYHGEITQGKMGLQLISEDPKLLFYHRKYLSKHRLISKQIFYLKVGKLNTTGSLLHLPRFFSVIKQKIATDVEKLIDYIQVQPGQYILYKQVYEILGANVDVKKIIQKYKRLKTDLIPYRQVYPNAKISEWKMKIGGEKHIRIVRVTPHVGSEEDDDEDEDDDDEQTGFLNCSERMLDRVIVRQCYIFIEKTGPRGISQTLLGQQAGLPSLQARSVCKYMVKNKICGITFVDVGRQRVSHFYSKKFDSSEHEMKEARSKLLQMVSFQEVVNNNESNDCQENSTDDNSTLNRPLKKLKVDETSENFFKNIRKVDPTKQPSQEDIDAIETEIVVSQASSASDKSFKSLIGAEGGEPTSGTLTLTILKRANLILQAVNTHRVIHDPQKLQRMINEEEESEGAKHVIDRKTVQRLIEKLEWSGHLRTIRVNMKGHGKERNMTFICHPSIEPDHSEIQSAIEQAKMKLPIITKESFKRKNNCTTLTRKPPGERGYHQKDLFFKYDQRAGKRYGFKPKFVRMQVLHVYMYYLIYGYNGELDLDQDESKNDIIETLNLDKSLINEMSTVYSTAINWKMFIPPLPTHKDFGEGWSLMSDLLLRLPLSIFVSIINIPYHMPKLTEYLNHPLRKFYLVKNLPPDIANHLTFNRKYIFSVSELITRLAFIGLVQMGPQKLKEKDQVFIYLNRHAILFDTTTSEAGYNHISKDIEYERINYHFTNKEALEQYWHDLWNCAMNTNLGCRNTMTGRSVVIEQINTKRVLMPCLQAKTCTEAASADIGYLPGDHLGAGGLDSDLFVHLRRSWYWPAEEKSDENEEDKRSTAETTEKEAANKTYGKKRGYSQVCSEDTNKHKKSKEDNGGTTIVNKENSLMRKPKKDKRKSKAKHKKITRVVKPKTTRFSRKPYYDQKDKEALKRMVKLRVDWTATEDNILLICKVASLYLSPNTKRQVAKNFSLVREILHNSYPNLSRNKTSRACQRRMLYMMKNPSTAHSVYMCLEEIKQDPEINDKFSQAVEKLDALLKAQGEGPKGYQKEYDKIFNSLVLTLLSKLKTITNAENATLDNVSIPDSLEEFRDKYSVVFPKNIHLRNRFNEVQNSVDILCSIVNTVLHSSLCCAADKVSYSYQLFYVYQQYPDKLLRSVMVKCRSMQIISCKKRIKRWKSANCYLPLSSSPYQLSITYVNILQTRYQYAIFSECYRALQNILQEVNKQQKEQSSISNSLDKRDLNIDLSTTEDDSQFSKNNVVLTSINNGGECANIVELYSADCIKLDLQFPEQLIILDPRLTKTEESYKLIVKRFRELISMIKGTSSKTERKSLLSEDDDDDDDDDDLNVSKTKTVSEEDNSSTIEEEFSLTNKSGIANPATRLALYLMRDEPFEHLNRSSQHAHDLFVLKPCKVTVQLHRKKIENLLKIEDVRTEIISDLRRMCVFPDTHIESDQIAEILEDECNKSVLTKLLNYLEEKKELGATYKDVENNVGRSSDSENILNILVQKQFILKSGSVNVRFIHNKFTKPWLIRSYFIPRYKREELGNTNTNSSYALTLVNNDDKSEKVEVEERSVLVDNNDAKETNHRNGDEDKSRNDSMQTSINDPSRIIVKSRKRKWRALSKESLTKFGEIDFSTLQPIHVSIRPWIRIDGTLNRRVLDRLLGALLGHCLSVPGTSLKQLQNRFVPALQPVHTLELVQMLEKIGCLRTMAITKSWKPSLFSKRIEIGTEPASGFDDIKDVIIEPELIAISKLGHFIGTTAYGKDYLEALTEAKMFSYF